MLINQLGVYFEALLDLIFPQGIKCIVCGKELKLIDGIDICENCYNKIEFIYGYEQLGLTGFDRVYSVAIYNEIAQKMIFDLKYYDKLYIAKTIAELMNKKLMEFNLEVDLIVAVPLHPLKERHRGYNQAHLICKHLKKLLNKNYRKNLLVRTKQTKDMNKLSRRQRFKNIQGVFEVKDEISVLNKNILLVDDVLTTGATVNACSIALLEAGAKSINVLTFARGYQEYI